MSIYEPETEKLKTELKDCFNVVFRNVQTQS